MGQRGHKRRQYIVDRSFQYGLIRKFAIVAVFIVIGSLSCLVLVYYKYGDVQVDIVQPTPFGTIDTLTGNVAVTTRTLLDLLWPVLSICLVGTIIFIFIFSVIISYRMAGPVYRMRRILEEMAQGDISSPESHLRGKDDFKQLFADINNVKKHWRTRIQELQLACQNIGEDKIQKQNLKRINDIAFSFKTKTE
jgi:methyl-accepting chemotaxis protein